MTSSQIGVMWLLVAIATDVISTIYMAKADGFNNIGPLIIGAILYTGSFIACVIALKYMQAGILYVMWSGLGAVATAFLAKIMLNQNLDLGAWVGLIFISVGLTIIAQFSSIDI
ncbi:quaternary ammonium compound-resistance protein QacE [Acinetobacter phage ZZ1]|uniref:Quaternary ammonium compound-resistance protein qacE n=3 Tax=Caudoviricetes TaxID=2731619 RepID=I3WVW1_9CAUD|nr:quaternary ammonium compound-resistance protein QacE [Acinetobacter phage ZZ1]AFL47631.1 putative quaternary ammonium compound-resistance protein qacE [Acinetobacter phage ZZ1]QAU03905.1 putative quaternary ammonium compound-resistance protein [Acinetobacter phage Henu6]